MVERSGNGLFDYHHNPSRIRGRLPLQQKLLVRCLYPSVFLRVSSRSAGQSFSESQQEVLPFPLSCQGPLCRALTADLSFVFWAVGIG